MLSYIELMNQFWQLDELCGFTGNETRLYFFLLKIANAQNWPHEFEYADEKLTGNVGQKPNTIKPCRDRLVAAELLNFAPGGHGRGSRVRYQLRYQKLTPNDLVRCQKRYQKLTPKAGKVSIKVSEKVSKIDTYTYIKETKDFSLSREENLRCQKLIPNGNENLPENLPPTPPGSAPPPLPPQPTDPTTGYLTQLQSDRQFNEGIQRNFKNIIPDLPNLLTEFIAECTALDKQHTGYKDFKSNAYYWLRIQSEKRQRHANTNPKPLATAAPGSVVRRTYSHQPAKPGGRTPAD